MGDTVSDQVGFVGHGGPLNGNAVGIEGRHGKRSSRATWDGLARSRPGLGQTHRGVGSGILVERNEEYILVAAQVSGLQMLLLTLDFHQTFESIPKAQVQDSF